MIGSAAAFQITEGGSLAEWRSFLLAYSEGRFPPDIVPPRPPSSSSIRATQPEHNLPAEPVYSSTIITDEAARQVRAYCQQHDYFPPPRSPHEAFRERLLLEYDIMGPVQAGNIQAAVDVLAALFPSAMCTFTLFRNNLQTIFAIGGSRSLIDRFGLQVDTELAPVTSLCGHSVLLDGQILFSPRMAEDWRFRSNPYTLVGIVSYIGSPVSLRCDPLDTIDTPSDTANTTSGLPDSLGIGAFNIMFVDTVHEVFTEQERMVVTNVTKMLMAQLRATWEGHIRTKEAQARKIVTELIQDGFDDGRRCSEGYARIPLKFPDLVQSALVKLISITELSGAAVIDLRGISTMPGKEDLVIDSTSQFPISTISCIPHDMIQNLTAPDQLLSFLSTNDAPAVYTSPSLSGLEPILPLGTRSHILVPFFSLRQPVFLFAGVSRDSTISDSTLNIARSVGSILLSSIVQTRVLEADAAKTAFLSSISHELRTPLYGLASGVELAQNAMQEGDTGGAVEILGMAQASGLSLSHILNDVLDFARPQANSTTLGSSRVDLVEAVKHAVRMCIVQFEKNEEAPEILLECEQRSVTLNEAKYHRILINAVTNAIKFCSTGTITISIHCTDDLSTRITDTGIGFDMQTLPHLLKPFTKQDQHSSGAGLGLHITRGLLDSLGGTLTLSSEIGKGTVFEAVLPVRAGESRGMLHEVLQQSRTPIARQPKLLRGLTSFLPVARKQDKLRDPAYGRRGPVSVNCAQAGDGVEAVEVFEAFDPDVVLTDVSMPKMDGVEAATRMREIQVKKGWKRCIIYALTGLGQSDPRLMSVAIHGDAALDGWLVKGSDQMRAVRKIIAEAQADREALESD